MSICKSELCNKEAKVKGFCQKHYARRKKWGDTEYTTYSTGHKVRHNRLYYVYKSMKARCYSKTNKLYNVYGGLGITICDSRLGRNGFQNFCNDMGDPDGGYNIMRVDKNSGYSPGNCKRSCNHTVAANRKKHNEVVGVSYSERNKTYVAGITIKNRHINLGYYHNFQDAANARRDAEMQYLGKYIEYNSSDAI